MFFISVHVWKHYPNNAELHKNEKSRKYQKQINHHDHISGTTHDSFRCNRTWHAAHSIALSLKYRSDGLRLDTDTNDQWLIRQKLNKNILFPQDFKLQPFRYGIFYGKNLVMVKFEIFFSNY